MEYLVAWYIEVEASTPREAALIALAIQRDDNSIANVFDVAIKGDEANTHTRIDLMEQTT